MALTGVSSYYKDNRINLIKQNILGGLAAARPQGDWRDVNGVKHTKNDSIFALSNPISVKSVTTNGNHSTTGTSFVDNNIFATLNQWHTTGSVTTKSNKQTSGSSDDDGTQNYDASSGRAAASSMTAQTKELRGQISGTEADAKTVAGFSSDATKLNSSVQADDKKFLKQFEAEQKNLLATQKQMNKIIEENNELTRSIESAQNELYSLQSSGSNSSRVGELQTMIGSKVGILQQNGRTVYSLSRTSSRSIRRMSYANKAYIKAQNYNTKQVEQQKTSTQKILDVATKIEQYSALTAQGGKLLDLAGMGLIALGSSMSGTGLGASVGAALIATGQVMSKIGKVAEVAGNYGQTAANLTKTAAYAAEGNLMGAMQSIGAAVQTGCAAVKGTKSLKADFAAIDTKANDALNKGASDALAKQEAERVKNETIDNLVAKEQNFVKDDGTIDTDKYNAWLKENGYSNEKGKINYGKLEKMLEKGNGKDWVDNQAFGGMTESQFEDATSANLQEMMRNGEISSSHKGNKIKRIKDLKRNGAMQYAKPTETTIVDGKPQIKFEMTSRAMQAGQTAKTDFRSAVQNAGGGFDENGKVTLSDNSKLKAITKKAKTSFGGVSYTPPKTASATDVIDGFQSGMSTMASMFGMNQTTGMPQVTTRRTGRPNYTITPRMQDIMDRNQRRIASRYAYRPY